MTVAAGVRSGYGVVWPALGQVSFETVEAPPAGPGDVVVDVTASVVSPGTERAWFLGMPNARVHFPFFPGYAASGVALEVGAGVDDLRPGDAVALLGVPHRSVATVPGERLRRIPEGVETRQAAILQLGAIARYAVRRSGLNRDQPFAVVGAGLIGALTQRLAGAAGAGRCTFIARSHAKELRVATGGAHGFLAIGDGMGPVEALEAPVVFEATGHADGLATALAAVAPGGRIVLLGSPRSELSTLPTETIQEKSLQIVGNHVCALERELHLGLSNGINDEADAVLLALEDGRLRVDDLFEPDLDPREAARFYRRLARDRSILGVRFDWTGFPASGRRSAPRRPRRPSTTARDPFDDAVGQVNFGMIGCGEVAVLNAEALALAPNTSVTACHDPVTGLAADLAARLAATALPTVDALLDLPDVDAVLLSVPHHLHAPLAIRAAQAGKHVVVEKPPANDLGAAVEMVRVAHDSGVTLSICFPHRFEAAAMLAERHVEAIGSPTGVEVRWFADKPPSYGYNGFTGRSPSDWRMRREQAGGGVLLMNLSHDLALVRHLLALEAEEVTAVIANVEGGGELEDHVTVGVRYENGAIGWFAATAAARGLREESLRIWGADGHLEVKPVPRAYTLRAGCSLPVGRQVRLRPQPGRPARAVFFSRFASAVAEGRAPDVTGADGLAVQALLAAAYRAADTGRAARPADLLKEAGA